MFPLLALVFYPIRCVISLVYDIVVAIMLLVWGFIVIKRFLPVKFKGTDFFVDTRGIALLDFEGDRDRIVKKDILLFADEAAFSVKGKFAKGSDGDDSGVVFTTKIQLKEGVGEKSKLKYRSFDSTVYGRFALRQAHRHRMPILEKGRAGVASICRKAVIRFVPLKPVQIFE